MNLEGHELYVINSHWLFDLTTFTGYRTYKNRNGDLTKIIKAFKVRYKSGDDCKFSKYIEDIPLGVLKKSKNVIKAHFKKIEAN